MYFWKINPPEKKDKGSGPQAPQLGHAPTMASANQNFLTKSDTEPNPKQRECKCENQRDTPHPAIELIECENCNEKFHTTCNIANKTSKKLKREWNMETERYTCKWNCDSCKKEIQRENSFIENFMNDTWIIETWRAMHQIEYGVLIEWPLIESKFEMFEEKLEKITTSLSSSLLLAMGNIGNTLEEQSITQLHCVRCETHLKQLVAMEVYIEMSNGYKGDTIDELIKFESESRSIISCINNLIVVAIRETKNTIEILSGNLDKLFSIVRNDLPMGEKYMDENTEKSTLSHRNDVSRRQKLLHVPSQILKYLKQTVNIDVTISLKSSHYRKHKRMAEDHSQKFVKTNLRHLPRGSSHRKHCRLKIAENQLLKAERLPKLLTIQRDHLKRTKRRGVMKPRHLSHTSSHRKHSRLKKIGHDLCSRRRSSSKSMNLREHRKRKRKKILHDRPNYAFTYSNLVETKKSQFTNGKG